MSRVEAFLYLCGALALYVALSRSRVLPRHATAAATPPILPTLSPRTLAGIFVALVTLFVPGGPPPPPPRDERAPPPPLPPARVASAAVPDAGEPDMAAPSCEPEPPPVGRAPARMLAVDSPAYAGEPIATGCGPEAAPLTPCEGAL